MHGEGSQILLDHANGKIKWSKPHFPDKLDGHFALGRLLRVTCVATANHTFLSQASSVAAAKLVFDAMRGQLPWAQTGVSCRGGTIKKACESKSGLHKTNRASASHSQVFFDTNGNKSGSPHTVCTHGGSV